MKLSIVIPCFNKFNFTKSCLNDLSKLPDNHEIIIIDNASSDDTKTLESNHRVKYFRFDENKGFAAAVNKGYQLSTSDNVLFLNNDIRVKSNHENWTNDIIKNCEFGLVGPTMGQLDSNLQFVQEANRSLPGNSYMSGWCLASSKNILKKLEISEGKVFSEEFFCYFEDTDLSFRAKLLNIPMIIVEIPVVHFGRVSSSQINTNKLYRDAREIFVNKWRKNGK